MAADPNFNSVVDLSNHAEPGDTIGGVLQNLESDNTLIEVPDATYNCGTVSFGSDNFGIVAKDGANPTFVATGGVGGGDWITFNGSDVLFEGVTVDSNGLREATIHFNTSGNFTCSNIHRVGRVLAAAFRANAPNGSTGTMLCCSAMDGGEQGRRGRMGFVPSGNRGTIVWDGCRAQYMTDNSIYCSPSNGPVEVRNCVFENNNISNIRVGQPATVENNVVIVDDLTGPWYNDQKMRGIWLRDRGPGGANITCRNNDIIQTGNWHPIAIEGGSGTVENNRIENTGGKSLLNKTANYTGSGNHITGTDRYGMPNGWIACSGGGCDSPKTDLNNNCDISTDPPDNDPPDDDPEPEGTWVSITGPGGEPTEYTVVADGEWVARNQFNDADSISSDGTEWTGRVFGGTDEAKYQGCIQSFGYTGPDPTVTVGGEQVSLDNVANCEGGEEPAEAGLNIPQEAIYVSVAAAVGIYAARSMKNR